MQFLSKTRHGREGEEEKSTDRSFSVCCQPHRKGGKGTLIGNVELRLTAR